MTHEAAATAVVGLSVIVLAGGRGERMGRDKMLIKIDGERLVDRVVRRLSSATDLIVVATGPSRGLSLVSAGPEMRVVEDAGEGPMSGVRAALGLIGSPLVAVVAADQPWVSTAVLLMAAQECDEDTDAVVPVVDGHRQVLHAIYRTSWLRRQVASGQSSLRRALEQGRVKELAAAGRFAADWDRPEDVRE